MRTFIFALAALFLPAFAQAQLAHFEVKEVGTGKKSDYSYRSDYGSYIRDVTQTKKIEVSLVAYSNTPVTVEAYWSKAQTQSLTLPKMVSQKLVFGNTNTMTETSFVLSGYYSASGGAMPDWLVIVRAPDGTPLGHQAQTADGERRYALIEEKRTGQATPPSATTSKSSAFGSGSKMMGSALDRPSQR